MKPVKREESKSDMSPTKKAPFVEFTSPSKTQPTSSFMQDLERMKQSQRSQGFDADAWELQNELGSV